MPEAGYKTLISYKLANIAFLLGWEFVPAYYTKYEDGRQRDQIKQALRSDKQNIVEGSSGRSLSSKLTLYSVAKASGMEALEDFEDILKFEGLPKWDKSDKRLATLRQLFEGYPNPSNPPAPSVDLLKKELGGIGGREGLEAVVNYLIDVLVRSGYMLDKQINALEKKHETEGGYKENLLKKRLKFRFNQRGFLKLTKNALVSYLIISTVIVGTGLIYLFSPWSTGSAEAAWFDDNWGYRQRIDVTVTSTASDISSLDTLITVDTDDLITAGKLQSSCQDLRFTNQNGKALPYFIDSGCNGNSTKIWVRADLVPKNSTKYTLYMYYGNPSAVAGSDSNTMYAYNGLVGYWTMNESSWTNNCSTLSVVDSSVTGLNGKACPVTTGPTGGATGNYANAGDFDGTEDYVEVADNAALDPATAITISAWVYLDTTPTDNGNFVSKGGNSGYRFRVSNDSTVTFFDRGATNPLTTTTTVANTTWTHLVATGDSGGLKIYINGVLSTSNSTAYGGPNTANVLNLGAGGGDGASNTEFLDGRVDDTRVYNRALSPVEITQLFSSPGSITTTATANSQPTTAFATEEKGPSPTLYWKFDDGTVGTAEDSTSNALDGTHNNTPTIKTEDFCVAGKCLWFDGTNNENVSRADDDKLDINLTDNLTVSAWVKRNGASSAINYILTKAGTTNGGYKVWMDASGDLCFGVDDDATWDADITSLDAAACTSGVDFDDDRWHFVTGVRHVSGTTGLTDDTVYLFVDGNQRASDTDGTTANSANSTNFYVGVDRDGTSNEWLGFIDEVKVYKVAKTTAQIMADYNARSTLEGASQVLGQAVNNNPNALNNGLTGYWKMDEASWTNDCSTASILDSSGNGNTGRSCPTGTGPAGGAVGKFGNAGGFDGANDNVTITSTSSLQFGTGDFTIAAWARRTTASGSFEWLIAKDATPDTSGWRFGIDSSGKYIFKDRVGVVDVTGASTFTQNAWQHVAVTRSGTTLKIFFNGVEDASGTVSSNFNDSNDLLIGDVASFTDAFPWTGQIDDTRVYKRALSPAEVTQLYNFAPGPVGYWKMEEGAGTSAFDTSGNANTGTITAAIYSAGKFGKGLSLDGSGDYILTASNVFNPSTTDFTGEAWFKVTTLGTTQTILAQQDGSGTGRTWLNLTSGNVIESFLGGAAVTGTTSVSANTWYHAAVTKSGTTVSLYLNGVFQASGTVTVESATGVSVFGCRKILDLCLTGQIDEVRFYNYARTAGQVVQDMNAGHPAPGSPVGSPIGYWKFDEGAKNMCSGGTNDACNSGSGAATYDGAFNADATHTNAGKFGRALTLDGTGDYTSVSGFADAFFTASWTQTLWLKSSGGTNYILTEKGTDNAFIQLLGGTIAAGTTGVASDYFTTVGGFNDGNWHHIAATFDSSTKAFNIYIDGNNRKNGTTTNNAASSATAYVMGARSGGTNALPGQLDEVKVYNSALTAEQVKLDMNRGSGQVQGALSTSSTPGNDNASTRTAQSGASEYCIPGDATTCTAPVGEWKMEEGTGTTAFDTSTNGNTGTLTLGPTWTTGKIGKAVNFDGTDDYINLGTGSSLNNGDTLTVSAWIRPQSGSSTRPTIYSERTSDAAGRFQLEVGNGSGGTNRVAVTTQGIFNAETADNVIALNSWQHVVYTRNGIGAGSQKIYVNGVSIPLVTDNPQTINGESGATKAIGAGTGLNAIHFFTGQIDQVRVFNYPRSAAQIAWDYNQGKPLGWWKMDECQGTVANDSSVNGAGTGSNGNTGTITIGASGTQASAGTCSTASTAWGNGITGKRNYSLNFDGTDDYIALPANWSAIQNVGAASFSIWAKPTTLNANNELLGISINAAGTASRFALSISSTGAVQCTGRAGDAEAGQAVTTTSTVSTNVWSHISCVIDYANDTISVYFNGVQQATTGTVAFTATSTANTASVNSAIGAQDDGSSTFFTGQLDDARLYNYALTAKQVQLLMNEGAIRRGPVTGAP